MSFQLSTNSTTSAIAAVTRPPVRRTSPVPTRFLIPSASVMMREISTPVLVESKYLTGSRLTCACTALRMSVMARCAMTPNTCDSANEVPAWTSVATPTAAASGKRYALAAGPDDLAGLAPHDGGVELLLLLLVARHDPVVTLGGPWRVKSRTPPPP